MGRSATRDVLTPAGYRLMATVHALESKPRVKVGILGRDFNQPKAEDGQGKNAKPPAFAKLVTVGMVGVWAEFGTETEPERSWLRSTVDEKWREWGKAAGELKKKMLDGTLDTDRALGLMGARIERDIKAKIRSNIGPPNAPSTLRAKAPKTHTLINTGQFVNSIAWELISGQSGAAGYRPIGAE
jgi:hypothetical protein